MKARVCCFALLLPLLLAACGVESVTGPEAAPTTSAAPEAPRMSGGFAGSGA